MKERKKPLRRCVGCGESRDKRDLIRIAAYEGTLSLDPAGKAKGRGVYICPDIECLNKAVKNNGFKRSLKMNILQADLQKLEKELSDYLENEKKD